MKTSVLRTVLFVLGLSVITTVAAQPAPGEPGTVESGFVEVEGGRIFYEAAGRGPAVVMIHDGLLHRETWNAQFAGFAESHRVIRWDRRGYGRSDSPDAPFRNIDDLFALMTALEIEHASLVLVGPIVSGFGFSEHFKTRGDRGMPDRDAPVDEKIDYWTAMDPWLMAPDSTAARNAMRSLMVENPQNLTGSGSFARWPGFSCQGRLSEIEVPTLIVVGESDIPDVHTHAGVIEGGIEGSRRVVLTHSGHLAHFEVPDAFNRVVLDFLEPIK